MQRVRLRSQHQGITFAMWLWRVTQVSVLRCWYINLSHTHVILKKGKHCQGQHRYSFDRCSGASNASASKCPVCKEVSWIQQPENWQTYTNSNTTISLCALP